MTTMTHETGERSVRYDPKTGAYRTTYDWKRGEALSIEVLRAVAATAGVCPTDLDELLTVDADALDDLFEPAGQAVSTASGGVWFDFSGFRVVVYADGEIEVRPVPSSADLDRS